MKDTTYKVETWRTDMLSKESRLVKVKHYQSKAAYKRYANYYSPVCYRDILYYSKHYKSTTTWEEVQYEEE
jgi:hypothetical protein